MLAAANRWIGSGPVIDGFFVITKLVKDSSMLDEDHLEGWRMTWNLMFKHLEMPLSQEFPQMLLEVRGETMELVRRRPVGPVFHATI